jgi:methylmalonyl-CoA mutase
MATRQSNLALSKHVQDAVDILKASGFDLIILETSGIGQSDTEITEHSDVCLYVMTPEYGAATQLEKIDMLDFADIIAFNKFDKRGSMDALRDVKKQYKRNHNLWEQDADDIFQCLEPSLHNLTIQVKSFIQSGDEKMVEKTGNKNFSFSISYYMKR